MLASLSPRWASNRIPILLLVKFIHRSLMVGVPNFKCNKSVWSDVTSPQDLLIEARTSLLYSAKSLWSDCQRQLNACCGWSLPHQCSVTAAGQRSRYSLTRTRDHGIASCQRCCARPQENSRMISFECCVGGGKDMLQWSSVRAEMGGPVQTVDVGQASVQDQC